jgi:hypothetical protein
MLETENTGNTLVNITLFLLYLGLFIYIFRRLQPEPEQPLKFYHPFDQWWRRKETNIGPWYQDHFFDSKRRDNLYPTYQTI